MVCQEFSCTPDVAEQQDWETVRLILEYRQAENAINAYRQGKHGVETFQKNPQLIDLLEEMRMSQLDADTRAALQQRGVDVKAQIINEMHQQDDEDMS